MKFPKVPPALSTAISIEKKALAASTGKKSIQMPIKTMAFGLFSVALAKSRPSLSIACIGSRFENLAAATPQFGHSAAAAVEQLTA